MTDLPFILNEFRISSWAFWYCKDINNDPEIKELITDPYWAFWYCKEINENDKRLVNISKKYRKYKI